jgi:hypothetical protein
MLLSGAMFLSGVKAAHIALANLAAMDHREDVGGVAAQVAYQTREL